MTFKEARPSSPVPAPDNLGKQSGSYRIDLSSVPPDESSSREPWNKLTRYAQGQVEFTLPDCPPLCRALPLCDLDMAIVEALREWIGEDAVVHWQALRRIRSSHGRALWKLDAHVDAIGEARDDAEARVRAARAVELLTGLQITVITARGELRFRAPLLVPIATTERNRGGDWLVDDILLRVHPMLSEPWCGPDRTAPSEDEAPVQVAPAHFAPPSLSAPVQVAPAHFAPPSLSAPGDSAACEPRTTDFPPNEADTARLSRPPLGDPDAPLDVAIPRAAAEQDVEPTLSEAQLPLE